MFILVGFYFVLIVNQKARAMYSGIDYVVVLLKTSGPVLRSSILDCRRSRTY